MSADPGDLVLDITCGSGHHRLRCRTMGRHWITCDTSRVATTLAKQRLMTAAYDYFQLAHPKEGVGSSKLIVKDDLFSQDPLRYKVLILLNINKIVQHLWNGIRAENSA